MIRRLLCLSCVIAGGAFAQTRDLTLDQLFTRPYIWGTPPEQVKWSKQNHVLVFLWNAEGRRFLDLYAYHADRRQLVRLTDLEAQKDDLTLTPDEKDSRRMQYPMPLPGIGAPYDVARDGSRVTFTYRGDVWIAGTTGSAPPLRLTRTKETESAPSFSPDGTRIAFLRGGQLYTQEFSTGVLAQITDISGTTVREYEWSPDGMRFAYLTAAPTRTVLLPNYSGQFVTAPPIPRSVVGDEPAEIAVWIVAARGGKPLRAADTSFGSKVWTPQPVAWSPDSTRLLRVAVHPQMKRLEVLVTDAETGKNRTVFEDSDDRWVFSSSALWAPDSRNLLISSERDGYSHLYKASAGGASLRSLHAASGRLFLVASAAIHSGPATSFTGGRLRSARPSVTSTACAPMGPGKSSFRAEPAFTAASLPLMEPWRIFAATSKTRQRSMSPTSA
jgi:dipeptidyl-peptidase 4